MEGFNENKYRRLNCYTLIRELQEEYNHISENLNENDQKLKKIKNKLLEIENKVRRNDEEMIKYRNDLAQNKDKLIEIEENMEEEENIKTAKLKLLEKHEANINRIQTTLIV